MTATGGGFNRSVQHLRQFIGRRGESHAIELGGVRLELHYTGRNHSDNSLVMILPKDKLAFTVDFVSVESVGFRDFPDGFSPTGSIHWTAWWRSTGSA